MMDKTQRPMGLEDTRAVYGPVRVPPCLVRDLSWGKTRYGEMSALGARAKLVAPEGQGLVVVYQRPLWS